MIQVEKATDGFNRNKDFTHEARALYYWHIEEKKYKPKEAEKIRLRSEMLANQYNIHEVKMLLNKK